MRCGGLALLLVALLAGCADKPSAPPSLPPGDAGGAAPETTPAFKSSTLKLLAARGIKPQPNRALNVTSQCTHQDEIGTRTRLSLVVETARVHTFDAEVSMKGRGTCRFELGEFEQVETLPQVVLRHRRHGGCRVRMWEEGARVTVAFNSCAKSCEGKAFDYLWPIVVETKSGRCF